ncbi:MAG: disulfide bond formation protein B [Pseudomonadota bacterium]
MTLDFRMVNSAGLLAIAVLQVSALVVQLGMGELPCTLCLLQRLAFFGVGLGLMLNVLYGIKTRHYAIIGAMAVFGAAISIRQILLHILPSDPGFSIPVDGFHFYTWAFIFFVCILLVCLWVMAYGGQYSDDGFIALRDQPLVNRVAVLGVGALLVFDGLLVFAQCGIEECHTFHYWILHFFNTSA